MLLPWLTSALAAPAVHVTATDTTGSHLLDAEEVLPYGVTLTSGKAGLSVYATSFHETRAVLELAAGKKTNDGIRIRVKNSVEIDPGIPKDAEITWHKSTFRVRVVLGFPADPPPTVPAAPSAVRFVRVWDDAPLLASPRKPSSATRERDLPGGRTDPANEASPMEVVDTWGTTHLEAETVPAPGPDHCAPGGPPAAAWPLQAYVARADLVEVTSRALSARFDDGSGYEVPPGTPVVDHAAGHATVVGPGLRFEVAVEDADVGPFYVPGDVRPMGDAGLTVGPGVVGRTALGDVRSTGPLVVSGVEGFEHPIAILRDGCVEARVPLTDLETGRSTSP